MREHYSVCVYDDKTQPLFIQFCVLCRSIVYIRLSTNIYPFALAHLIIQFMTDNNGVDNQFLLFTSNRKSTHAQHMKYFETL